MHYLLLLLLIPTLLLSSQSYAAAPDPGVETSVVFSQANRSMSLDKAYQLQKAFVRNQASYGNVMAGFKTELVYPSKQQKYALNDAITGILMRSAIMENNSALTYQEGQQLVLKMGLAYKATGAIRKPVVSVSQLKKYFTHVMPAVELPLFSFTDNDFNGFDIIANNAMAHKIILLDAKKIPTDLDHIEYKFSCQDEVFLQSSDSGLALGQWETLLWMVNHLIAQGYAIRADHVLFTGGFHEMLEAKPCAYTADYGELGKIQFTVE